MTLEKYEALLFSWKYDRNLDYFGEKQLNAQIKNAKKKLIALKLGKQAREIERKYGYGTSRSN